LNGSKTVFAPWLPGSTFSQVTSDTVGLRSLLAESGRRSDRRSSCGEIFEDPTYTAELAQREILVPLGNFEGELDQKKGDIPSRTTTFNLG